MISDGMGSSDGVELSLDSHSTKSYKIELKINGIADFLTLEEVKQYFLEEFCGFEILSVEEVPVVETNNSQGA